MIRFCNWLSDREGRRACYRPTPNPDVWSCDFAADGYRLPTEAEWDYAARAGASTRFFFGNDPRYLPSYAHVTALGTAPGGTRLPNRWGLFDMVGNVWESCWDRFDPLSKGLAFDPAGAGDGPVWVGLGGAYDSGSYDTWAGFRGGWTAPETTRGFRVACGEPTAR